MLKLMPIFVFSGLTVAFATGVSANEGRDDGVIVGAGKSLPAAGAYDNEQSLYLWLAYLLNGHDAALAQGAEKLAEVNEQAEAEGNSADEGSEGQAGGCAATPGFGWGLMLPMLWLAWRRRRERAI